MRLRARVAMEEGLLSVCISQSMSQSRLVNEYCYLLKTQDLQEQGHISYVAIVIGRMKHWRSCECFLANYIRKSFLLWTISNIQYLITPTS